MDKSTAIALSPEQPGGLLRPAAFSPAELAELLAEHPDYRILRRFQPQSRYKEGTPANPGRGVILDTETTGRDPKFDRIIEMGLVSFSYDRDTGEPYEILDTYNSLEDPGMPIDPAASIVNGITDEMVKGHQIDDAAVERVVTDADLVIAHNSSFDRDFCERRHPIFKAVKWACSRTQINWEAEHIGGQKLDYIAYRLGFFYAAHRAEEDCRALLHVLASRLPVSGVPALKKVLERYEERELRVWAVEAPFEKKNMLSARKYRWANGEDGKEKAWHIQLPESELDNEVIWLRSNIYGRPFKLVIDTVDAYSRFSPRRIDTDLRRFA